MSTSRLGTFEIEDSELGFKGFICINSLRNGLAFGGCRISPTVSREEVEELAFCMNLKLAAHGFPVGGAKGGIQISPKSPLLGKSLQKFAIGMKDLLTQNVLLGKDLGATTEMLDRIYESVSIPQMHIVTNGPHASRVPSRLRDLTGYQSNMTGLGVATAAKQAFAGNISAKKVLIQGCGAVGVGAAIRLSDLGAKISGMSDIQSSVYLKDGISIASFPHFIEDGRINPIKAESLGFKVGPSSNLFSQEADLLVLAAASHSVNPEDARKILCEKVVEGSNFGLVSAARKALFEMGIPVIPDVIASSSSAAMGAHQMASRNGYSHDQLWKMILPAIEHAVAKSVEVANLERVDIREAYVQLFASNEIAKSAKL